MICECCTAKRAGEQTQEAVQPNAGCEGVPRKDGFWEGGEAHYER